jgi:multiple sugar transport system permease protein
MEDKLEKGGSVAVRNAPVIGARQPRRGVYARRMWIKRLTIVAFVTPAVVMLVLTRLWPTAEAIYDSLFRQSLIGGTSFGGLANYVTVAKDPVFLKGLTVTAIFGLIVNPFQIVLALVFAVVLSERWRGAWFFRTVILFPAGVPSAVAVVIFGIALRPDGPVNGFLHDLGLPSQPFLNSPDQALASIILIVSWIGVGYWVIFLVGGVQDIPTTLYEAAEIDGAGWWKKFFSVTLPLLRRPLLFVLVADTIANALVFAPVQILTQGGPDGSTNLMMYDIYQRAYQQGALNDALAETVMWLIPVILIVAIQFRLLRPNT